MATEDRTSVAGVPGRALVLPVRTVLLVAATIALMGAFWAIGDTFLVVFVGIFLALVFEAPLRWVMAKTHLSRGMASAVTVLGTALAVLVVGLLFLVPLVGAVRDFLQDLPQTIEQLRESDELSGWLGDSGAAEKKAKAKKTPSSAPAAKPHQKREDASMRVGLGRMGSG